MRRGRPPSSYVLLGWNQSGTKFSVPGYPGSLGYEGKSGTQTTQDDPNAANDKGDLRDCHFARLWAASVGLLHSYFIVGGPLSKQSVLGRNAGAPADISLPPRRTNQPRPPVRRSAAPLALGPSGRASRTERVSHDDPRPTNNPRINVSIVPPAESLTPSIPVLGPLPPRGTRNSKTHQLASALERSPIYCTPEQLKMASPRC